MPHRHAAWPAALLLSALVLFRAFPFVWWSGTHFDSDQAIVGLMAKHIAEGRAFPLYFYGQNYLLAVEAYLAAPVMLVAGPTVTALKTPLVLINVAIVLLLLRVLRRDAQLPPLLAAVAALPVALPSAGVAARWTEANGGNVEPALYVLLLWMARARPWVCGLVLGAGMLHREFTAYGAAALAVLEIAALPGSGVRHRIAAFARRWAVILTVAVAVHAVAGTLRPLAAGLGPGTRGDDPVLVATEVAPLGGRVCLIPSTWPERAARLTGDHLPRLVGGFPAPLREYGVLTGVFSGVTGLAPWVGGLTALGLAGAVRLRWRRGRRPGDGREDAAPGGVPPVAVYLMLTGLASTLVYGFLVCSDIRVETMRYNLLGVLVPVGALAAALTAWPVPAVRAGIAAAVVLWCAFNTSDVWALTREYMERPPVDQRQAAADTLVDRGVGSAVGAFRNAYHITFLAGERVRVSAADFVRIRAYFEEAMATGAPRLSETPCDGGEPLTPGLTLCPP